MKQYMYEIGYGFIAYAKFCKQLLYKIKSTLGKEMRFQLTVSSNTHVTIINLTRAVM